jgi:hypothetical protein
MNSLRLHLPKAKIPNPGKAVSKSTNLPRTKNPFYYLSGSISATQKRRRKLHG